MKRVDPVKRPTRIPAAQAAADDGTLWHGTVEAGAAGDRMGWPLAAGVIVLLSVGLWVGIGWLAAIIFG